MTTQLATIWIATILVQFGLILRTWRTLKQLYPVFILYLVADLVSGLALFFLAYALPHDPYTGAWIVTEILLVLAQFFVCKEAAVAMAKLRIYLPEVVFGVGCISVIITAWIYRALRTPQHWNSWLEPAAVIKAIVNLALCLFIVSMITVPRRWSILRTLEFKHAIMLAVYFGVNSFAYFGVTYAYSVGKAPPEITLMMIPLVCFSGWMVIMRAPRTRTA